MDSELKEGLLRAEAGVSLRQVVQTVARDGWWPAASPSTPEATLGGCVAMNVTGPRARWARRYARVLSTFSLAALLGGSGGDRAAQPAPVSAQAVAQARLASASLPRFALFGWVSPPNDSTTDARIAELAGAGLDVALPAWADSGRFEDNLRRIRYAADHGVRCLAWDERFDRVYNHGAPMALLDTIVADYASEPGFLGYYFTDEPPPEDFPLLAQIYADLAARDPVHPAWNDLRGLYWFGNRAAWESYARSFIETVHPSVLVNNQYDFLVGSDRRMARAAVTQGLFPLIAVATIW